MSGTNKNYSSIAQGRLTGSSGIAYTTSDVTAITSLVYTPSAGNLVGLWTGSDWSLFQFPELSISLSGLAASTVYDVFITASGGSPALTVLAWTNTTTRATSVILQDGTRVLSSDATQKYLGTFQTTSTTGQTEHSKANRLIWNAYNRKFATMSGAIPTSSWTISGTQALRASNTNTTAGQGRVNFVIGFAEEEVSLELSQYTTVAATGAYIGGIGWNSTSANSASYQGQVASAAINMTLISKFCGYPIIGANYLQSLESTSGIGAYVFAGAGGHSIIGRLSC